MRGCPLPVSPLLPLTYPQSQCVQRTPVDLSKPCFGDLSCSFQIGVFSLTFPEHMLLTLLLR